MVDESIAWLVAPATAASATEASTATSWLAHRVAAVNLRRLINLGLDHHGGTWPLAT